MNRPRYSVLYMPGSNARALEKARSLSVDTVIFDLEDAVAPEAKPLARRQIIDAVSAGGYTPREVVVRVNAPDSPWWDEDINAVSQCQPDGILVPKISAHTDVSAVTTALAAQGQADMPIWVMIETASAVVNIEAIAASVGLVCLVMGFEDLSKETRIPNSRERTAFTYTMSRCVMAARANGLAILDGVYADYKNSAGFEAECRQAKAFGFDGKTLIHPVQIEVANTVFAPSQAELEMARKIVAAWDTAKAEGKGVAVLDGRMIEYLHAEQAQRIIELAERLKAR